MLRKLINSHLATFLLPRGRDFENFSQAHTRAVRLRQSTLGSAQFAEPQPAGLNRGQVENPGKLGCPPLLRAKWQPARTPRSCEEFIESIIVQPSPAVSAQTCPIKTASSPIFNILGK